MKRMKVAPLYTYSAYKPHQRHWIIQIWGMSIDAEVPLDKIYSKFPFFDVPSTALWKKSNATYSLWIKLKTYVTFNWFGVNCTHTHTNYGQRSYFGKKNTFNSLPKSIHLPHDGYWISRTMQYRLLILVATSFDIPYLHAQLKISCLYTQTHCAIKNPGGWK